jgi:hypothetical protein
MYTERREELKGTASLGDELEHDHIPSFVLFVRQKKTSWEES